jgi:uncharacterized membrane protein
MGKSFALITLILGLLTHPLLAGGAAVPKIVLAHGALNARIALLLEESGFIGRLHATYAVNKPNKSREGSIDFFSAQ